MAFIRNFARTRTVCCETLYKLIFLLSVCMRLVRFDHGLAISSRSIMSVKVRSRSHARLSRVHQGVPGSLLNAYNAVFTDFSFEKLRSADADVTATVRRVTIGFLIDRDTSGVGLGACSPRKFLIF
jgi:hypothetical protein